MSVPELWNLSTADHDILSAVPVCGCGQPQEVWALYRAVLASCPPPRSDTWPSWEDRLAAVDGMSVVYYLVADVLDHAEFLEHGGSVGGAWRTERGERLLLLLDQWATWDYEPTPCTELTQHGVPQPTWEP